MLRCKSTGGSLLSFRVQLALEGLKGMRSISLQYAADVSIDCLAAFGRLASRCHNDAEYTWQHSATVDCLPLA
jgi:hypothetical protein